MKRTTLIILLSLLVISSFSVMSCRKKSESKYPGVDRYNQGIAALEAGNYKGAIVEFTAALEADPNNYEALKNLAGAYAYDGNWTQALERYHQALQRQPNDASIYVNLAQTYRHLKDPEQAWQMLRSAMTKDPNYPLAHYVAGELFMDMGDTENAIAAFSDYIAVEQGSMLTDRAQRMIDGLISGEIVPGVDTEIIETTEEIQPPEDIQAEIEQEIAEREATEEPVEETPEPEPAQPEAEEETPDETPETPEETTPEVVEPELQGDDLYNDRLSRGRRMRAIGSTDAAIRLLLEAYAVHPDYAQVNYELGMAYLAAGQNANARTHLEKYLQLETNEQAKEDVRARLRALDTAQPEEPEETTEEPESEPEPEPEPEPEED